MIATIIPPIVIPNAKKMATFHEDDFNLLFDNSLVSARCELDRGYNGGSEVSHGFNSPLARSAERAFAIPDSVWDFSADLSADVSLARFRFSDLFPSKRMARPFRASSANCPRADSSLAVRSMTELKFVSRDLLSGVS